MNRAELQFRMKLTGTMLCLSLAKERNRLKLQLMLGRNVVVRQKQNQCKEKHLEIGFVEVRFIMQRKL